MDQGVEGTLIRPADVHWFWLVAAAWAVFIAMAVAPASLWFRVDRVYVHDTVEGQTPAMDVSREIVRSFDGEWVATIVRKDAAGFYTYCTATGRQDYRTIAHLPDNLDLDWWTWPTKCELPPGTYVLRTLWIIDPPFMPKKEVRIRSNEFRITQRSD